MPDTPLVTLLDPNGNKVQGPRHWAEGPFKQTGFKLAPSQREADTVAETIAADTTDPAAADTTTRTRTTSKKES